MSSTTSDKLCKRSKTSLDCVMFEEDRISNLPGSLIGYILSLAPTKDAVATSVLSKRWKKSWTLITQLDFNDDIPQKNGSQTLFQQQSFINFVYGVLQRCTSSKLSKFHLVGSKHYDSSHVISWICIVLKSSVQDLNISVPMLGHRPVLLPWNLFASGTLVELSLGINFELSVPSSVSLPSLKVLSLDKVKLSNDDTISKLIGGCPQLQKLKISECIGREVTVINITAPALESLVLTSLPFDDYTEVSGMTIVIETPKLSYFFIDSLLPQGYQVKNFHCLNKAVIDVEFEDDGNRSKQCKSLESLLQATSKVKVLQLTCSTMESITVTKCQLPLFKKIVELNLDSAKREVIWKLFPPLLKNMPNLTTLTIAEVLGDGEKNAWFSWDRWDVPSCFKYSLRKIEIKKFKGMSYERAIVRFILKNAKVLEKLILHYDVLKMRRASSACEVMLSWFQNHG